MELKDYYAILGVQPTDDLKTIKTAYDLPIFVLRVQR